MASLDTDGNTMLNLVGHKPKQKDKKVGEELGSQEVGSGEGQQKQVEARVWPGWRIHVYDFVRENKYRKLVDQNPN